MDQTLINQMEGNEIDLYNARDPIKNSRFHDGNLWRYCVLVRLG